MRIAYAILVLGSVALAGGSSYAADLGVQRGRSHAYGKGTFDQRLRVVEQVPYCGNCEAPFGRTHSANVVRLHFINRPYWQESCAAGACGVYYPVMRSCGFWGFGCL
ncbi:MAG TPA: hypothetical protein VH558_02000 [Pseudolabrys sp.]